MTDVEKEPNNLNVKNNAFKNILVSIKLIKYKDFMSTR